jgi:uncharacterized iron-regulated protein
VQIAFPFRALVLLGILLLADAAIAAEPIAPETRACGKIGTWFDPATGKTIAPAPLMASLARRAVVLLGEEHDNAEHHRWQLQMLASLHAHNPELIVGFEMFPRRVQPALDAWASGRLDAKEFLKQSDWAKVWGFHPDLYLPLFHFARQNRLSMLGLNVDRSVISKIGREGWDAVPAEQRGGVSTPATASDAYLRDLADIWIKSHRKPGADKSGKSEAVPDPAPDPASVMEDDDFKRFVGAQQTWDRAMAEALADALRDARKKRPNALVVGVMGQGHAEYGHGVPHQLKDLGVADTAILLPVESTTACDDLPKNIADAVFIVAPRDRSKKAPSKARLGVMIETTDKGVRIMRVVKGSVAEASSLAAKDIVILAAGQPVKKISELIAIIGRQAPGTWLPLMVRRDGKEIEVVAKFPANFKKPE